MVSRSGPGWASSLPRSDAGLLQSPLRELLVRWTNVNVRLTVQNCRCDLSSPVPLVTWVRRHLAGVRS